LSFSGFAAGDATVLAGAPSGSAMSIVRYIVQGFGWRIGSEIAKEGIEALDDPEAPPPPMTPRQRARHARARERATAAAQQARVRADARRRAELEAELAALKAKAGRGR
jgi:hypothetical protein